MNNRLIELRGADSINVLSFVIATVLAVLFSTAQTLSANAEFELRFLVPVIVGQIGAFGFLWLVQRVRFRKGRERVSLVSVVLFYVLSGFVAAAFASGAAGAVGLTSADSTPPSPLALLLILVVNLGSGIFAIGFASLVSVRWREYVSSVAAQKTHLVQIQHASVSLMNEVAIETEQTRQEILEEIMRTTESAKSRRPLDAAETLNAVALDVVRDASHELWHVPATVALKEFESQRFSVEDIENSLRLSGVAPRINALVAGLLTAGLGSTALDPVRALIVSALAALIAFLGGVLFNSVGRKGSIKFAVGLSSLLVWCASFGVWIVVAQSPAVSAVVMAFAVLTALVIASGLPLAQETLNRRVETGRELEAQLAWHLTRAQESARFRRQHVARLLHGPVQSLMQAAALRLQQLHVNGEDAETVEVLDELTEQLKKLNEVSLSEFSLKNSLNEVVELWRGITEISIRISDADYGILSSDELAARSVHQIVLEACNDAVKHSRAAQIEVTVTGIQDKQCKVVVRHSVPETADSPLGKAGLGSTMLDEITLTWHRDVQAGAVTLTAAIPVDHL